MRSFGRALLVEDDLVLVIDLYDVHIGHDVGAALDVVLLSGTRVESANDLQFGLEILHVQLQQLGQFLVASVLQLVHVLAHDDCRQGVPSCFRCLSWRSRHSSRSRAATPTGSNPWTNVEGFLQLLSVVAADGLNLLGGRAQIAIAVDVADDRPAELLDAIGRCRQIELPDQVIRQVGRLGERVLEGRQFLAGFPRSARGVGRIRVGEVGFEVDLVEWIRGLVVLSALAFLALRLWPRPAPPREPGSPTAPAGPPSTSSSLDICNSLIACCNDGVITSRWLNLTLSFCSRAIPPPRPGRSVELEMLSQVNLSDLLIGMQAPRVSRA